MPEYKDIISVVIPCREKNTPQVRGLLDQVSKQEIRAQVEVDIIEGVKPAGKARNLGAKRARGDTLIFLDEDITLGNEKVLYNLTHALNEDKTLGVCAASVLIPPDSSLFQRMYAAQIPHSRSPVTDKIIDVWVATSACCAVRKELFSALKGFNNKLPRGQDPEFSLRVRNKGLRTVIVPQTWFYHPLPENLAELLRLHYRNGAATSYVDRRYPGLNIDIDPRGVEHKAEAKRKVYRLFRFVGSIIGALLGLRFLLVMAKIAYAAGYFRESLRIKQPKNKSGKEKQ